MMPLHPWPKHDRGNNYYAWVDLRRVDNVAHAIASLDGLGVYNSKLSVSKATTTSAKIRERQEYASKFPITERNKLSSC